MIERSKTQDPKAAEAQPRKRYVAPTVTLLGRLDDLTLGGSGSAKDKFMTFVV